MYDETLFSCTVSVGILYRLVILKRSTYVDDNALAKVVVVLDRLEGYNATLGRLPRLLVLAAQFRQ